ncbi:YdcF family protein [Photobacterium sagamiensis]|uniref:YdcF family protein n=1 Tax=Photobacterium sagamiensis TaxID=2910241 RepID=UPI003D0B19A2
MKKLILAAVITATFSASVLAGSVDTYAKDATLAPVVEDFKTRQFQEGLNLVDAIVAKDPANLDAHRMGMLIGTNKDDFTTIIHHADSILAQQPTDAQALYMKAIYSKGTGLQGYDAAYQTMSIAKPNAAKAMKDVVTAVDALWEKPVYKEAPDVSPDGLGILALGSPANPDGTPQPRLQNTLNRTLELANAFPKSPIFVTGGAIYTSMTESQAMKNWLVKNGVDADRIVMEDQARDTVGNAINIMPYLKEQKLDRLLLVTVEYHLRRSALIIDGVLDQQGVNVDVVGVAGESDKIGHDYAKRMIVERAASYRDRGRAYGLFQHDDFLALDK